MINLYPIIRPLFYLIFKFLFRPKVVGKENIPKKGSVIIVGNHRYALDPAMLCYPTRRTVHFLAKKDLYGGIKTFFFNSIGALPVDKHNKDDNASTINKAEEALKNGGMIGLFPEGTRNKTEEKLLPFKKGAVNFAKNTDSYLVPTWISGEYKIFKKSIKIVIGKPYKIKDETIDEANTILRNKVLELMDGE